MRLLKKVHISSLIFSVGKEARCDKTRSALGLSKIIKSVEWGGGIEAHLERDGLGFTEFSSLGGRNDDLGFLTIAGQRPLSVSRDCLQLPACGLPDTRSTQESGSQVISYITSSHHHIHTGTCICHLFPILG